MKDKTTEVFDVIVIGLGAMGSATTYQLAKRGAKVLGIDRFNPPHSLGSTHGDSRITRQAIGEGEEYVPFALRSNEIWNEIERETGKSIFTETGGIIFGSFKAKMHGENNFIQQTIASARTFGIKHEILTATDIQARFPQFKLEGTEEGYFEPRAGFLRPELCVEAQLELAIKYGAILKTGEEVTRISPREDGEVEVETSTGTYQAKKVVVSAGPWIAELFPEYESVFKVYRQVLYWFDIEKEQESYFPENFPIFIWVYSNGDDVYGFPAVDGIGGGLKIASEQYETECNPNDVQREVSEEEIDQFYNRYVKEPFPGLRRTCVKAVTCLYTVTPDHKFVIDTHPAHKQIIIASPCSGHGFKHSAAVGETLAELALTGTSTLDVRKFSMDRFKD